MSTAAPEILTAFATASAAAWALSRIAWRLAWTDDPGAAPARKRQARPVPSIGGAAILLALLVAEAFARARGAPGLFGSPDLPAWPWHGDEPWHDDEHRTVGSLGVWTALLLAFALGWVDDRKRGGLSPGTLLVGQILIAAGLVFSGWHIGPRAGLPSVIASAAAIVLVLNVVNTFDNADGAATSVSALGLAAASPVAAAALAGFLPFNLWIRPRGDAPRAYLGNSGSLVVAVLMLIDPVASCVLVVPALDLARLCVVRLVRGGAPWVGDRRHLAHRLQVAGLGPSGVVGALLAIAAPSAIGALIWLHAPGNGLAAALGAATSAVFFAAAVRLTPDLP